MLTVLRTRRLLVPVVTVLAVLAVLVLGVLASFLLRSPSPPTVAGQQPPHPVAGAPTPGPAPLPKSEPVSVDIPAIGARSSLVPLGLNPDGTIQVPPVSTPMQAGWYEYGPTPGEVGPAVVLGHVDGNKTAGIFYRLHELKPGEEVDVARKNGGTAKFVVTKVDEIAKDRFPTEAVYGDTAIPELRLITCGGGFDHAAHSYVDNIIVYATLE